MTTVAIIGAGWYGCHVAASMQALGFDTTVFEQHHRPLHEASGNNQFRLHLGFHYPRHHGTRVQSRDGFNRFMERYGELSREVHENIYAVPRDDSLIDFATYRLIMTSSGIDYREVDAVSIQLQNVDGIVLTHERILLIERARQYFKDRLGDSLHLGEAAADVDERPNGVHVNGTRYDLLVDATWGHRAGLPMRFFYEPTILLYYETERPVPRRHPGRWPAVLDLPDRGPRLVHPQSSVPHTPAGPGAPPPLAARRLRDGVTGETGGT